MTFGKLSPKTTTPIQTRGARVPAYQLPPVSQQPENLTAGGVSGKAEGSDGSCPMLEIGIHRCRQHELSTREGE